MTSGVLTFGKFPVDIFCWVEQVDEIEALTVFDVVAVGEELDVSYDGVIILSWFNSQLSSIQVNIVWAPTELKAELPTTVYDFCRDDANIEESHHSKYEEDDTCI
jgi:hypothetical protein